MKMTLKIFRRYGKIWFSFFPGVQIIILHPSHENVQLFFPRVEKKNRQKTWNILHFRFFTNIAAFWWFLWFLPFFRFVTVFSLHPRELGWFDTVCKINYCELNLSFWPDFVIPGWFCRSDLNFWTNNTPIVEAS